MIWYILIHLEQESLVKLNVKLCGLRIFQALPSLYGSMFPLLYLRFADTVYNYTYLCPRKLVKVVAYISYYCVYLSIDLSIYLLIYIYIYIRGVNVNTLTHAINKKNFNMLIFFHAN